MKTVSANYTTLRNQTGSYYDVKMVRGTGQSATEYGMDKLKSIKISQALFDGSGPQIANARAAQCTMSLRELSANWPRMADFEVFVRVSSADGSQKSSWLSMGKYYTDTRKADKYGNLTITAYDWMLLFEQTWADKVTLPQSWPITARAMANLIVSATGVQIDARSVLDDTTAYIGLDTRSTAREMLSVIAAGMGGNWTMTVDGKLLLVGLRNGGASGDGLVLEDGAGNVWRIPSGAGRANDITLADRGGGMWHLPVGSADVGEIPVDGSDGGTWHIPMIESSQEDTDSINLGLSIVSFEANTELPPVHTVEFVSDSGTQARSTDEVDGYTLLAHCNFASTNIANLCLEKTRGYCYKPFSSTGARLDPAAELGDFVQIDNEIFPIISITWRLGKHIVAEISAPFEEDVDHEYPMLSENQKTLQKAIGAAADSREYVDTRLEGIESEFEVLSDRISAKVDKVHQGEHTAFSWELTDLHHNWYTVDGSGTEMLVMSVTGDGLRVVGEVKAKSGVIGIDGDAFSIVPRHTETVLDPESGEYVQVTYPSSIQNGIATFDDNQHDGVYIGTDGIRLGRYFTVNKRGELAAKSGVIGGFTISQNALYSGGASSYSGTGDGVHLSASGIRLGDNFKVSNSGVVNASGLNMTGGTINLTRVVQDEDTGQDITETVFYVSSGGSVNANFTGGSFRIGDKMLLSGNSLTLGGFNIGANSISSTIEDEDENTFSVNISPYGISLSNSDGSVFAVDSSGNASFGGTIFAENISGAVTQEQLAQAVQTSLGYAQAYNSATQLNPQTPPAQFTATALYAVNNQNVGGFVNAQRYMTIAAQEWGYSSEMQNSVVPTAAHWHSFTEGTGADAGKIFIGQAIPATSTYANQHFFDIADTQFYRDGVSAVTISSIAEYSYSSTADKSVVFDNDHVHYDSGEDTISGRARVVLSNNNALNIYIEMDASAAGGICPVMGIDSMAYAQTTGVNAYSQVNVTFTDESTGTYSLPTVYNTYASEYESLYNYARYIGGRTPTITNRSVTPSIYDTSNPYVLPVDVEFNTNGNAQSFEATVDVYVVYEEGRRAGGGGIAPVMAIDTVDEYSYSSTADHTLTFSNAYVRYYSNSDMLCGRMLVTMEDGNTETVYVQLPAERKSMTPPSYTVTNGNVEEDPNNPYDSTNPYVFNVVATFDVDGNSRSYTSFVNVFDVYQAGASAGASYTITNGDVSKNGSYDSNYWQPVIATFDVDGISKSYTSGFSVFNIWNDGYTQGIQDASVDWSAVRIFTDDVRAAGKYVDILYNGDYVATGLYVYYNGDED